MWYIIDDMRYIHTYIQTLLKLPKWVFQFNTIKTYAPDRRLEID